MDNTTICFETERLMVRHFTPADLDDFASLCADPQVMRYMGDGNTLSRSAVAAWIDICQRKYVERGYGTSAVFEKHSGKFIGMCGVVRAPDNDFDELIYAYHVASWGQGLCHRIRPRHDRLCVFALGTGVYLRDDPR